LNGFKKLTTSIIYGMRQDKHDILIEIPGTTKEVTVWQEP